MAEKKNNFPALETFFFSFFFFSFLRSAIFCFTTLLSCELFFSKLLEVLLGGVFIMGTGKKEATRRERQGKTGDGMGNVRTKGENFYR